MLAAFGIEPAPKPNLARWQEVAERIANPEGEVTIAIVGKYTGMKDAYKSLIEALAHGGIANRVRVKLDWIECEIFESEDPAPFLEHVHGILVPGGFGQRGAEGKIRAAGFARERKVPYFGICFGMQMAVIEAARSLAGIADANSTEFGPCTRARRRPDDGVDARQRTRAARRRRRPRRHHAARRLPRPPREPAAASPASTATPRSPSATATATRSTWATASALEAQGHALRRRLARTACCPRRSNIADHPWFIGVQYHPELKSRPFEPHPLFASFIAAAVEQSRLV